MATAAIHSELASGRSRSGSAKSVRKLASERTGGTASTVQVPVGTKRDQEEGQVRQQEEEGERPAAGGGAEPRRAAAHRAPGRRHAARPARRLEALLRPPHRGQPGDRHRREHHGLGLRRRRSRR